MPNKVYFPTLLLCIGAVAAFGSKSAEDRMIALTIMGVGFIALVVVASFALARRRVSRR